MPQLENHNLVNTIEFWDCFYGLGVYYLKREVVEVEK